MATISKRRRVGGGTSWDAMVRVRGYPTRCKSFRTRLEAEAWASRTESAAHGRTLVLGKDLTLGQLIDEAAPKLRRANPAAINYWRGQLGALRTREVTPSVIARHRDLLTGAPTRAHGHKKPKPRTASTVRSYLATSLPCSTSGSASCAGAKRTPFATYGSPAPLPVAPASSATPSGRRCWPPASSRNPLPFSCLRPSEIGLFC